MCNYITISYQVNHVPMYFQHTHNIICQHTNCVFITCCTILNLIQSACQVSDTTECNGCVSIYLNSQQYGYVWVYVCLICSSSYICVYYNILCLPYPSSMQLCSCQDSEITVLQTWLGTDPQNITRNSLVEILNSRYGAKISIKYLDMYW